MNRKERRAQAKYLQKTVKMSKEQAKEYIERQYSHQQLEEGTKVKLNWELIRRHLDWKIQRKDFKEWVEAHKDEVFTVEWDKKRKENNSRDKKMLVCLAEDTTEPKWLFFTSTLIPQAVATITMEDGTENEIVMSVEDAQDSDKIQAAINEALNREAEQKGK